MPEAMPGLAAIMDGMGFELEPMARCRFFAPAGLACSDSDRFPFVR